MNTTTDTSQAPAMPVFSAAHPARTTSEQLAAIDAGATVNERYELAYEPSKDYTFEASTSDGTLKDTFTYYGPFSAGFELAEQRGAARGAIFIGHFENARQS